MNPKSLARKARSAVKRFPEQLRLWRSIGATFIFRTHVKRWHEVAHAGKPIWDDRNQVLAESIPAGSSVLDIGCGPQTLRQLLKPGCKYQPCDVIKSTPDVIFCDFNAGIFPDPKKHYDFVICSGVFEYIRQPDEFLRRVPRLGSTTLLSYNPFVAGASKIHRLGNNWVNHFTRPELEELFEKAGLRWEVLKPNPSQHLIYALSVKSGKPA